MTAIATRRHAMQCMEIWGGNRATDHCVTTPGLEMWISSRPHGGAAGGGDLHYVSLCGGGSITRIMLADVSGHGATAAELAGTLRHLMRRNINRKSAALMMTALNRRFADIAAGERFATAVVATYLTKGDRLTLCNAGHPRPLVYRAARGDWSVVKNFESNIRDLPLGIDNESSYAAVELPLARGDLVLLYTDALTEATDESGDLLGEDGLLDMVRRIETADPAEMGSALLTALTTFRGGELPDDDQTFILLHHTVGHPRRLSLRETLDVYAKVLHLKSV